MFISGNYRISMLKMSMRVLVYTSWQNATSAPTECTSCNTKYSMTTFIEHTLYKSYCTVSNAGLVVIGSY